MYRRPESVLILVYTKEAEVLMLKRSKPFPCWQSVTGSLRDNETQEVAASRELREETGLIDEGVMTCNNISRTFAIDSRWQHKYKDHNETNIEYEFCYLLDNRLEIKLNSLEHTDYCWLPIDAAIKKVWSWTNKQALELLASKL